MKAPQHEVMTFGKYGDYKITKKNFWLVSDCTDAYGKQICEGDKVYVSEENYTYTVRFDGNAFILTDSLEEPNGFLVDFNTRGIEVVGHIAEDDL